LSDAAPEFIDEMLSKIVGIEIEITSLMGKSKLSQNRQAGDRLNAAEILATRGHGELAAAMREAS
jgi:transcriptional regulator